MRMWLVCAGLLLAVLLGGSAFPQSELAFSSLDVDLWPEYDRPTVLVMYRMEFVPPAVLPVQVSVRIPSAAGSPNAVAELQADGHLVSLPYQRRRDGDWAWIDFTAHELQVQIEYYDPRFDRDGSDRSFEFTWPGDYDVGRLVVSVQQPVGASDLQTAPNADSTGPGARGLLYHSVELGSVQAGQPATVALTYQKESDALSTDSLPPADEPPPPETASSAPEGAGAGPNWVWAIAGLTVVLIGTGLVAWRLSHRSRPWPAASPDPEPEPERSHRPATADSGAQAKFCPQCGAPAASGDRFCHGCGAKLQ